MLSQGKNRIQELYEVSELAAKDGRFDVVETCYLEIQEIRQASLEVQSLPVEISSMNTLYMQVTPISQIISDRLTQLIGCYGRKMVIDSKPSKRDVMLNIHMKNLELTYGKVTCLEVKSWFKA